MANKINWEDKIEEGPIERKQEMNNLQKKNLLLVQYSA